MNYKKIWIIYTFINYNHIVYKLINIYFFEYYAKSMILLKVKINIAKLILIVDFSEYD